MGKLYSKLIFMAIFHFEKELIRVNRVKCILCHSTYFSFAENWGQAENELSYFGGIKKVSIWLPILYLNSLCQLFLLGKSFVEHFFSRMELWHLTTEAQGPKRLITCFPQLWFNSVNKIVEFMNYFYGHLKC